MLRLVGIIWAIVIASLAIGVVRSTMLTICNVLTDSF
jgi:hypothetical protein